MKTFKFLTITILALMLFAVSAQAQRKTTRKATTPKTTPAATTTAAAAAEIHDGAVKVGNQLYNVAKFNYFLGGIATGLEDMDKGARTKPLSQAAATKHAANKQAVVNGIRDLRSGLATLEVEFRTKPGLKRFQFQIGGISDLAGQAEDLAAGGQFYQSGKVLVQVIQKLSDTLVAMP